MSKIILTTSQLQEFIAANCPSVTVRNSMRNMFGEFTNLGAFNPAPGSSKPGFVCRIKHPHGNTYHVAVTVHGVKPDYHCYLPDHIDWASWVGGTTVLYGGDLPARAERFRAAGRVDNLIETGD